MLLSSHVFYNVENTQCLSRKIFVYEYRIISHYLSLILYFSSFGFVYNILLYFMGIRMYLPSIFMIYIHVSLLLYGIYGFMNTIGSIDLYPGVCVFSYNFFKVSLRKLFQLVQDNSVTMSSHNRVIDMLVPPTMLHQTS